MRAFIYTRRSTEKQDSTHESQEQDCRNWAILNGFIVEEVFRDDCSGSLEVNQREGFLNAINALSQGDVLIMKRRDRLGRDVMVNAIAEKIIQRAGARIITTDLGDVDSIESELVKGIFDQFAQFELKLIQARTKTALALRKQKGLLTGTAPLGLKADTEGLLIDNPEEKLAVKRARVLKEMGLSLGEVMRQLGLEGITCRSGQVPSRSTVSRWIRSEMTGQLISDSEGAEYVNQSVSRPNRQRRSQWSSLVIDKVKSLKESGLSLRKIAEELKRFPEIKTRNGKALSHTQVARILKQSS